MSIKIENTSNDPDIIQVEDDEICELEHLRKLFIGGLTPYTTEESLKDYYGRFGKVVDVVVMRDPTSKRSRGFGFVTYTKSSMVDKAQENRPHMVDGKSVEAKRALPRPDRESRESNLSVKKLFVGGLKDNHDEQCLEDYFSQFGKVISVKILTDKSSGKRRGFAFIEFDDYDSVDKAILQKTHSIKYVLVDVKKSIYKHDGRYGSNTNINSTIPQQTQQNKSVQNGYRGKLQQAPPPNMPGYPQRAPMNGGVAPPPPVGNYNYWGPPPPGMQPPYGGYQPPPTQMNNWNYTAAPQQWQAGPPPAAANWYPSNQWGGAPPANGPPPVAAPIAPGAPAPIPPVANWTVPPQVAPVQPPVAPVTNNGAPPVQPIAAPVQQQQPNFGTGYQQSYAGGPTKNNMHQNRMNPYVPSAPNHYATNVSAGTNGYGGYNAGGTGAKPGPVPNSNNVSITAGGNSYRR